MDYGVMFEQIRKLIEEDPDNITILEEVIDVDLQMDYFKESITAKKEMDIDEVILRKEELFSEEVSIDEKRKLLPLMASVNNVEVFRAIERYMKNPEVELREWSILAYQESRMLLQSSLMEKAPVFISTGLGGKGDKLRYCIVFFSKDRLPFTELQQNIINGEVEHIANRIDSPIEELIFENNYCSIIMMIPLKISVKDCLVSMVNNCNELGGFVDESFLVTNVKHLNKQDIIKALEKNDSVENNNSD